MHWSFWTLVSVFMLILIYKTHRVRSHMTAAFAGYRDSKGMARSSRLDEGAFFVIELAGSQRPRGKRYSHLMWTNGRHARSWEKGSFKDKEAPTKKKPIRARFVSNRRRKQTIQGMSCGKDFFETFDTVICFDVVRIPLEEVRL